MRAWATAAIIVLLAAMPAVAQTAQPAAEDTFPHTGQVTGDNVYVRSGAGLAAYPCAKVSRPDRVTVLEQRGEWLKILPVKGCHSAISRDFVKLNAAGTVGTVTGDNVRVYAAGVLRRAPYTLMQGRLDQGDTVRVIGQDGAYYLIAAPRGATYWISGRYVQRITVAETTETPGPTETTETTETTATTETTLPEVLEGGATTTEPAAAEGDAVEAFRAAEKRLQEEFRKPAAERNIDALIAMYKGIDLSDAEFLKSAVDQRLAFLGGEKNRVVALETVDEMVEAARHRQREYEMQRTRMEVEVTVGERKLTYDAEGVLVDSAAFTGGPTAPKRYILRDPRTGKANAYVQSTTGQAALAAAVGKYVGVLGRTVYDADLSLDVIDATKVVVLRGDIQLPATPQPTVKPLPPKPEPKPEPAPVMEPEPEPEPKPESKPEPVLKPEPAPETEPKPTLKEAEPAPLVEPEPAAPPAEPAQPAPAPTKEPEEPEPLPAPSEEPAVEPDEPAAEHIEPAGGATELPASVFVEEKVDVRITEPVPAEPRPDFGKPAPESTEPAEPLEIPISPSTQPAAKPLPPTGLPVAGPETQPAEAPVDEKEYD